MRFLHFIDRLNVWSAKLFSPVFLIIMFLAVYEIFRRYILSNPTTWAWEINSQLLCFIGAMAGGYTLLNKAHVSVDILSNKLPKKVKAFVDLLTAPLLLIFCGTLVWYGAEEAWFAYQDGQTVISQFASPLWPIKSIIPLGSFLLFLQGIAKCVRDVQVLFRRKEDS